jgi:putative aldouronate transport system substrate-binding protein
MRRILKQISIAVVMLVMVTGFAIAGAQSGAATTEEPVVVRWFGQRGFPGEGTQIPGMLEELISKKVGFPVQFEHLGGVADNEVDDTINMMMAANDLPDIFPGGNPNNYERLNQAAATFSLEEFQEYMPGYLAWQREIIANAGTDEAATWAKHSNPETGELYGLPNVWVTGWVPSGQMWRKDILDDLGYDIPTTIAEAEEVFEAYKAAYPDKYALTGRGKTDWQCFDVVFNAFGLSGGDRFVRDGVIKEFFATREFREALEVLRRWYAKGFWDPNFENHALEWITNFAAGDYIITQWTKDWDYPEDTRWLNDLRDNVPGAMAVAATHIAADKDTKPGQRVWDPFTGGVRSFGKHLEEDEELMHKMMQVLDTGTDREVSLLAGFGIEGEHYEFPEGETAPQLLTEIASMSEAERNDKFGFGFFWAGLYANIPTSKKFQNLLDKFVLPDDAIYGKNNLTYNYAQFPGRVYDETGESVQAETKTRWFEMVVDIMTGKQPIEYYDEWLEFYYDSGGRDWEKHATRLYLN